MNNKQVEYFIKLAKSIQAGFNSNISTIEVNNFLTELIDYPFNELIIRYDINANRKNNYMDFKFIIVKSILFYNKELDISLRVKFLEYLLNGKKNLIIVPQDNHTNIGYWVRILFSDYDNYIKYNPTWQQLIYLFVSWQVNRKQKIVSKLIVEQFNKNFRSINFQSRRILLDKLMQNESLRDDYQKLVLKNLNYIPKAQLTYFHENLCNRKYKFKFSNLI